MSKDKLPSIWQMTKSFSKDLTKYISEGAPNVSPEDYTARLSECNSCEYIIRDRMRCGKCGCLIEHKAKWKTTSCPDSRWKTQILDGERQESNNTNASN